jgi:biopolymer transport protein ExbB
MDIVIMVKNVLLKSGAGWVLWLLGTLSVISLAVCFERLHFMRKRSGNLDELAFTLEKQLAEGKIKEAREMLARTPNTPAAIALAGLNVSHLGRTAAEQAMLSRVAMEREHLSRHLVFLGTVGSNAPFVGLFGTVVGIVEAFEHLGTTAATAQTGQMASAVVMSSLAGALVATAVGIFVAIPAVAAYNYFQRRVASILTASEVVSRLVLAFVDVGAPGQSRGVMAGPIHKDCVIDRNFEISDTLQSKPIIAKVR